MKITLLLILDLWYITGFAAKIRYDGFNVYRINPSSQDQIDVLLKLQDGENSLDFWTEVNLAELPVDVMVSPREQRAFVSLMEQNGMHPAVYIEDVQKLFENEKVGNLTRSGRMTWTSYYRVADINTWLDSLAADYPGVVTVISAGKSYENRDIKGVKISFKTKKKNVFIEGGIHAREWIAPATVTYIINEVLTSTDSTFRKIAESFDWYIFPSTNPDGYEYSHTTTRFWRKTRTPYGTCAGADPNRNWDFFWGVKGTSTNPCSKTYGGSKAFSEKETSGLADYIKSVVSTMDVYFAFHSYSQFMLIPYGHTDQHLENYDDLLAIGKKAAESLASRYGTRYKVGNTAEILYKCSGTSMDWVKYEYKIPISYTYELRDSGRHGFALPADQIIPNCLEVVDSLVTIFLEAEKLGYFVLG